MLSAVQAIETQKSEMAHHRFIMLFNYVYTMIPDRSAYRFRQMRKRTEIWRNQTLANIVGYLRGNQSGRPRLDLTPQEEHNKQLTNPPVRVAQ